MYVKAGPCYQKGDLFSIHEVDCANLTYSRFRCTGICGDHCLISSRGGQGTSLQIMRLATMDPHSQKVHSNLYKIPKFGVNNRPNIKRDTAI